MGLKLAIFSVSGPHPVSQNSDPRKDNSEGLFESSLSLRTRTPNFAEAQGVPGLALGDSGDLDAAINEERDAIRLKPNPFGLFACLVTME